jgi:hypothetical protein
MKPAMSLLGLGIAPRLVIAAVLAGLVWLLVAWALA